MKDKKIVIWGQMGHGYTIAGARLPGRLNFVLSSGYSVCPVPMTQPSLAAQLASLAPGKVNEV